MLPQITGIPLPSTDNSTSTSNTVALNRTLPVGQNVSATVIAVSRDQIQPEIFRLRLEVNNRLIQMGVFQPLPVGQKVNITLAETGQIQIQLPAPDQAASKTPPPAQPVRGESTPGTPNSPNPAAQQPPPPTLPQLRAAPGQNLAALPEQVNVQATVISSRPLPITGNNAGTGIPTQATTVGATQPAPTSATSIPVAGTTTPDTLSGVPGRPIIQASSPPQAPQAQNSSAPQTANPATPNTQIQPPATPQPTTQPQVTQAASTATAQAAATAVVSPAPVRPQTSGDKAIDSKRGETQNASSVTPSRQQTASQQPQPQPAVSTTNPAAPRENLITLLLADGRQVQVISNQTLQQGSELQLTRSHETVQATQLRPQPEPPASALDRPVVKQTLRDVLPSQIPVADAFSQLAQVASRTDSPQAAQISGVVRSLLQLFGVRPGAPEAAGQIRQNIELGGLSAEQRLSRGIMPGPQDMRQQLQQLSRLSEKLPPDKKEHLEQLVRGLHSRVTSQQLNSLQQWREMPDGSFERVMQLDLPIRQGERWENVELRLSREARHSAEGDLVSQWRVRLHFDLESLGALDAEIRLTDQHQISALFWCEKPETTQLLQAQADDFAERLRQCGFSNTEIQSQRGQAPKQHAPVHKELIDLHT
ncbi:flagellar hook-length control protein FliK [Neptuniibacter sp. CAU 1671]|uniref:flagellar hook-length control protein FliK n=1 Tax=Neptuniibacter sp. CAU 1671 TaxID=3032593 RepID=UPI0023DAD4E1|nr:flagellar hook-length control protein FliK [Neptuniibacter sp. CAU 1671]MDF2181377.1 flagellar hook-length control protein FliK [Neptuniibacter sp. CAU 1671]